MNAIMKIILFLVALLSIGTNAETTYLRTNKENTQQAGTNNDSFSSPFELSRRLDSEKPTMHTFYHKIEEEHYFHGHKSTGMTDEDDLRLVATWEAAWQNAGWNTRVIGLKEAMEHPEFERFDRKLEDAKRMDGGKLIGYYDKLCFLRWLAMVSVGGGWIADYDTLPLRQTPITPLPFEGKFSLYEYNAVPSLASGSKDEYDRIAHRLLDSVYEKGIKTKFWSDMFGFQNLREEYNYKELHVMKGRQALALWADKSAHDGCDAMLSKTWAIHFSHEAINLAKNRGILGDRESVRDRSGISQMVIKDLIRRCDKVIGAQRIF